jgi:hypothetical protein
MRTYYVVLMVCCFLACSFSRAENISNPDNEINYLLNTIEKSGCRFIRNGTPYSAIEAKSHLLSKYSKVKDRIKIAEQFIELIGAKSSVSGEPYLIECTEGKAQKSEEWLKEELKTLRAGKKPKD